MSKPLTPEEREEIEKCKEETMRLPRLAAIESGIGTKELLRLTDMIVRLHAAEAFWRSVVKNSPSYQDCEGRTNGCFYCEGLGQSDHATDCPWLLAQSA